MNAAAFTIALIGVDGAGKTTLGRRLERDLSLHARYLYMGVNSDSSNRLLPTTRAIRAIRRARGVDVDGGPPDPSRREPHHTSRARRVGRAVKDALRLTNLLAEELYRQALASSLVRRGVIVVFDRHFFVDYYAHDVASDRDLPLGRRLHGFVLSRLYPKPDLVLFLDAPVELLRRRKGEGTLEALTRRREEYLALANVMRHFAVLDAGRPADRVARDAIELIEAFDATGSVPPHALPPTYNGKWPGSS
jgi:thymidylate kinase